MRLRVAGLLAALALLPAPARAQTAANVLLVINGASSASVQIGDHYAAARRLSPSNVVRLTTSEDESIDRAGYEATIEAPIARWLSRHQLQDQVLFIVLTKGIPLRVEGTGGQSGTVASVDSELTLLYRRQTGIPVSAIGRTDNPYFLGDRPLADARRFSRLTSDLYLVTRLDGFSVADVRALIDRGVAPAKDGAIVLDQRATMVDRGGDAWLAEAAARLKDAHPATPVAIESTRALANSAGPVLGYFSWGSNDPTNQRRGAGLAFAPGAIGGMFVSTDGRTFREPGTAWKPAPTGSTTGGQSLVGDLIREGITGVSGHVAEPYLDAIVRPQVLFPAYLSGYTLAEAFYLAMPYLSWQTIVIGDPLCAPFMTAPVAADQIHAGLDPETDLPALFSKRSQAVLNAAGFSPAGVKVALKGMAAEQQGRPAADVRALLEQATTLEPRLVGAQLKLAEAAEARRDIDDAIARYRAVIAAHPGHVMALNNLAYRLADAKGQAREALPLAERAYTLSGQSPIVGDTLAWVHFKLGNAAAAQPLVDRAASLAPDRAEIHLHAAFIHEALKDLPKARAALETALKLDPALADRDDVKALTLRIR